MNPEKNIIGYQTPGAEVPRPPWDKSAWVTAGICLLLAIAGDSGAVVYAQAMLKYFREQQPGVSITAPGMDRYMNLMADRPCWFICIWIGY